jgi:hypothetical protein
MTLSLQKRQLHTDIAINNRLKIRSIILIPCYIPRLPLEKSVNEIKLIKLLTSVALTWTERNKELHEDASHQLCNR